MGNISSACRGSHWGAKAMNFKVTYFAVSLAVGVLFGGDAARAQTCDDAVRSTDQAGRDFNQHCVGQRYVRQLGRCVAINNQHRARAQLLLTMGCSDELNSWARNILRAAAIADRNHAVASRRSTSGSGGSGYAVRPDMPHKPNCFSYGVGC